MSDSVPWPETAGNWSGLFSRRPFTFGENWGSFASSLSQQAIERAAESLVGLLGVEAIRGRSFLDVGCGSGLFSASAARLGASRVVALDVDAQCVSVARSVAERLGVADKVETAQGSILDAAAPARLGPFDVVYAWGSLHHTGAMWRAIETAASLVQPQGTLVLAIYRKSVTSPFWRLVKRTYNAFPRILRYPMLGGYLAVKTPYCVVRGWPLRDRERGMNLLTDAVDWLGGFPYEYASAEEVTRFVEKEGFRTLRVIPTQGAVGCNQFVFERMAADGEPKKGANPR
jgi:2-polyprenyl-6-hydroxyphenyl methylase/3-demethylubiquinone-9 3-methyltransferase